ncbi:MAG: hypothetical protein P1U39_00645 [Legionellaceae bacterium]|nr:hypothetical protein [Legionellaceae bacterium]
MGARKPATRTGEPFGGGSMSRIHALALPVDSKRKLCNIDLASSRF